MALWTVNCAGDGTLLGRLLDLGRYCGGRGKEWRLGGSGGGWRCSSSANELPFNLWTRLFQEISPKSDGSAFRSLGGVILKALSPKELRVFLAKLKDYAVGLERRGYLDVA